jgi:hypothetical protein
LGSVPEEELPEGLEEYPLLLSVHKETGLEWVGGTKIIIQEFGKSVHRESINL